MLQDGAEIFSGLRLSDNSVRKDGEGVGRGVVGIGRNSDSVGGLGQGPARQPVLPRFGSVSIAQACGFRAMLVRSLL